MFPLRIFVALVLNSAHLAHLVKCGFPTVILDQGTFTGVSNNGVNKFLGIPFGKSTAPPNRFKRPVSVDPYKGRHDATTFGPSCPQQDVLSDLKLDPSLPPATVQALTNLVKTIVITGPTSEDCLSINVIAPSSATRGSDLPIIAWVYGGGFAIGGTVNYDGTAIVRRSIALGQPVIFVSMNYRVSAWGYIGGAEINAAKASNLGLRDQRLALRWIHKYIKNFGGDPGRVTLWGESAGSISVAFQMLINGGDTNGLFHSAFMESGSAYPSGDASEAQPYYDALVQNAGCSSSSDTLLCLANVNFTTLSKAVNMSPNFFQTQVLPWQPRVDGDLFPQTAFKLIAAGKVARIPFVNGVLDDEGTTFSLGLTNITTDADFQAFIKSNEFPSASDSNIQELASFYPSDPAAGSPFGTGIANAITPQTKRLSALQGDYAFQSVRRVLFNAQASKVPTYSYIIKRGKSVPIIGSSHGSDLPLFFQQGEMQDYLIHFAQYFNPNFESSLPNWPKYDTKKRRILTLWDGAIPMNITTDTFRENAINKLIQLKNRKV